MVHPGSRAPSTGRAQSVNRLRKQREKPYKVQFESVMAKKKKLKLLDIHGSAKPLNGYTYLPVGFADLAEECKELSRRKDADVGVVSAGSRSAAIDPTKLSHHIYRVGYHFRTDVFDLACQKLGYCQRNGKLEKVTDVERPSGFEQTMSRYGSRFDYIDLTNRSEETSMKVKQHIRELFPKIPEADLQEIYERAWEQGARTVGNANDLSLSRQVQLATIARIRHMYTDYDHLLRVGTWKDARTAVEHKCLAKLIEWRGEHDHDPEELEEILRETIVIDDESDDDSSLTKDPGQDEGESDTSLEIMQHTVAPKDLRVEPNERGTFTSRRDGRRQNRLLPAVLQARWQHARSERYGDKPTQAKNEPSARITVALDDDGKAPRTLRTGGVQYVRLSPDLAMSPRHHEARNHHGAGYGHYHGPSDGYVTPTAQHMQPYEHSPRRWAESGNAVGAHRALPQADLHDTFARAAIQSIEQPHDGMQLKGSRAAVLGQSTLIDLTTPPKPQHRGVYANIAEKHGSFDGRAVRESGHGRALEDSGAVSAYTGPRSQVPVEGMAQNSSFLPRHQRGTEMIDLTASPRDCPVPSFESRHDQAAAQYRRPPALDRVYQQPVYGQAAYPQMRPRHTPAPTMPPKHGAPSTIQPVSVSGNGVPSPKRVFVGARKPTYELQYR